MSIESREQEVLRIEHELEVLRASYTTMQKLARVLKAFVTVSLPNLSIIVLAMIIIKPDGVSDTFGQGPIFWVTTSCLAAIVGAVLLLLLAPSQQKHFRWIDIATSVSGFLGSGYSSDAELIEEQIAAREKRLTRLKGGPS